MYYFDTSAIVKAFHKEEGSNAVETLFTEDYAGNYISQLTHTEFCSTLYKKLHTKEIKDKTDVIKVLRRFDAAIQYTNVISIDDITFSEARRLMAKWALPPYKLRTLDALHLGCFIELNQSDQFTLITCDEELYRIVTAMECKVINPVNYNNGAKG